MSAFILAEDEALRNYLLGMIVMDGGKSNRPIKVYFGTPDIEIGTQEYPYMTIHLLDVAPAFYRKHQGGKYITSEYTASEVAPTVNQVMIRPYPEPYDLTYQVTSFARDPRHDRQLITQMSIKFPGHAGVIPLSAPELSGIFRPVYREGFNKSDRTEGQGRESRRLFRNMWTLRVPTELDPEVVSATTKVLSTYLNTSTTHIPTKYQPI